MNRILILIAYLNLNSVQAVASEPISPSRADSHATLIYQRERVFLAPNNVYSSVNRTDWIPIRYYNMAKSPSDELNIFRSRQMQMPSTMKNCSGFDNILNDFGILSLTFGLVGTLFGGLTNIWSVLGVLLSVFSISLAAAPSSILLLLERLFGIRNDALETVIGTVGVLDTLFNLKGIIPFSVFTTVVSILGTVLGIVSILLGVAALFPEELESGLGLIFGESFVKGYGCRNPYQGIANSFADNYLMGT